MNNSVFAQKVAFLLQLMPYVMDEGVFAVHGGTAINLYVKNMPRYSVDIDLTYIPLANRADSILAINDHLRSIVEKAKRSFPKLHVMPNYATCKLLCEYHGYQIKVEVNQTKRGIIGGEPLLLPLCERAQKTFGLYGEATIVPPTLLYGGKLAAALSRQHPRDLFDVKYMNIPLENVRAGLIFCLLGSDRPIHESLAPKFIDQREAMANQFEGMTDIVFTYEDFEATREQMVVDVNNILMDSDKEFLLSFESGAPNWSGYEFESFQNYPSVQWKLLNLAKLKTQNPDKLQQQVDKLRSCFNL